MHVHTSTRPAKTSNLKSSRARTAHSNEITTTTMNSYRMIYFKWRLVSLFVYYLITSDNIGDDFTLVWRSKYLQLYIFYVLWTIDKSTSRNTIGPFRIFFAWNIHGNITLQNDNEDYMAIITTILCIHFISIMNLMFTAIYNRQPKCGR